VTAPRGSGTDDRGAAWRKPAFLLLAVIPVALVVPIVAARPWLGLPVLTLGMLAGLGFMTVGGEPDDRALDPLLGRRLPVLLARDDRVRPLQGRGRRLLVLLVVRRGEQHPTHAQQ